MFHCFPWCLMQWRKINFSHRRRDRETSASTLFLKIPLVNISACIWLIFAIEIDSIAYDIFLVIIYNLLTIYSWLTYDYLAEKGFSRFHIYSDEVRQRVREQQRAWGPSDAVSMKSSLVNHRFAVAKTWQCSQTHFEIIFYWDNVFTCILP